MLTFHRRLKTGAVARIRFSDRDDGDATDPSFLSEERGRWSLPRQVHSAEVRVVEHPGEATGLEVDALVSSCPGAVLAIRTADCVPIALVGRTSVAGVHAGWRGLERGIIAAAVEEMIDHEGSGPTPIRALVGPHIHPERYEFGSADLGRLEQRFGPRVAGRTFDDQPALDLWAAVSTEFDRLAVGVDHAVGRCTAGDQRYFSHRARRETERMVMLVEVMEAADEGAGHERGGSTR